MVNATSTCHNKKIVSVRRLVTEFQVRVLKMFITQNVCYPVKAQLYIIFLILIKIHKTTKYKSEIIEIDIFIVMFFKSWPTFDEIISCFSVPEI